MRIPIALMLSIIALVVAVINLINAVMRWRR